MTKPSAPNGDNTVAASKIVPISPTIAADAVIVDSPEKLDLKSLPVTRVDSIKLALPAAEGRVRGQSEVPQNQLTPNAKTITRVDR